MACQKTRIALRILLKSLFARSFLLLSFTLWFVAADAAGEKNAINVESRYQRALELAYGLNGVERDRKEAISILKVIAQEGDATSQNLLGSMYSEELGIFRNHRKANDWFAKAAAQNNPYAQYNLAFSYRMGRGVKRDDSLAEQFFREVVEPSQPHPVTAEDYRLYRQTVAAAHYQLGGIYSDYSSSLRDWRKSIASMEAAEAGGIPMAALYLATQYALGERIEKDLEKADYYLERYPLLAENELRLSARSMFFEGMNHEETSTMVEIADKLQDGLAEQIMAMQTSFGASLLKPGESYNPEMARRWLEAADNDENHAAKLMLSRIYYRGLGIDQNLENARALLENASDRYTIAKFNLGVMMVKGEGGDRDVEGGRLAIREAADDHLYVAYRYLENGVGLREYSSEEAMAQCRLDSDSGDFIAQFCLGYRYLNGFGLPRDEGYARKLIGSSAEAGFAPAQYTFGVAFPNVIDKLGAGAKLKWIKLAAAQAYLPAKLYLGREQERIGAFSNAARVYQECADGGMPEAMMRLARLYQTGRGVAWSDIEALTWLRRAAEMESVDAYRALGEVYRDGLGVDVDIETAKSWFEKGARANHIYSQYDLARLIAKGDSEKENWEEALVWYEKAAENGHYNAMYELAESYRLGRGVAKSRILAAQWYSESAGGSRGMEAMYEYARLILEPGWSQSDPDAAEAVFRLLEGRGFILATFELAKILASEKGEKKRLKKAYGRFKKVAVYGRLNYESAFGSDLNRIFRRGIRAKHTQGFVENRRAEVREAAIESSLWLARMTELGEGVKANRSLGVSWYRLAAESGNSIAQYELAVRLRDERFENLAGSDFVQWLRRSADNGYREAQFEVGRLHFEGSAKALDRETSIEYLKKAADQNHDEAKELLRSEKIEFDNESQKGLREQDPNSKPKGILNAPLVG